MSKRRQRKSRKDDLTEQEEAALSELTQFLCELVPGDGYISENCLAREIDRFQQLLGGLVAAAAFAKHPQIKYSLIERGNHDYELALSRKEIL